MCLFVYNRAMGFRLQRQRVAKDLSILCLNRIKKDKIEVPRASREVVRRMPAILREIRKNGLPTYLLKKKLKGKLGYGIFLHPKAEPILRGTPIAPYSGKVILCHQNMEKNDSDYAFALITGLRLTKEEQRKWDPSCRYHPRRLYSIDLDARKNGNFTRFINHSEKPNIEAQFVRIPPNSAGLSPVPFELIYVASKTIRPGEQLLICYEAEKKSYWGSLKPFPMTPKTFILNQSCEIVVH